MDAAPNVNQTLDRATGLWAPIVVGRVNNYEMKAVLVEGGFLEHVHDDSDEMFLILAGRLHLDMPGHTVSLGPMDVYTVPRGVPHRPRAEPGTRILTVEPQGTAQRGTSTAT